MLRRINTGFSAVYNELSEKFAEIIKPYSINTKCTDVLEETLLFAAEVEEQPTKCRFKSAPKKDGHHKVCFQYLGLSTQGVQKLTAFFQKLDESIKPYLLLECEDIFDIRGATCFEVPAKVIRDDIIDILKTNFYRFIEARPDKLKDYQKKVSEEKQRAQRLAGSGERFFCVMTAPRSLPPAETQQTDTPATTENLRPTKP